MSWVGSEFDIETLHFYGSRGVRRSIFGVYVLNTIVSATTYDFVIKTLNRTSSAILR